MIAGALLAIFVLAGSPLEEPAVLIRAARVHPVASPPVERGQVLVRGGKIAAVGTDLDPPPGARVIDLAGELFPGLIDCGAPLGIAGNAAEEFRELTPEMRAADGLDLDLREVARALSAGVTAVAVTPGERNVIGGLGAVVKTAPGRRAAESLVRADAFLSASLTLAASDSNQSLRYSAPTSFYHRLPTTRMGTVFLLRRAFFEALDLSLPAGDPTPRAAAPAMAQLLTPPGKAVLAETLRGARPLRLRAQERQEIEAALRIASEFKAAVVLEGFAGGVDLVPRVKARGLKVLLVAGLPDQSRNEEALVTFRLAQVLDDLGVEFAFSSGTGRETAELRERLSLALRFGPRPERVLRAATLGAARILGVETRLGTIEPGKDADLVAVRGGGPLEGGSAVEWVMVDGRIHPGLAAEAGEARP